MRLNSETDNVIDLRVGSVRVAALYVGLGSTLFVPPEPEGGVARYGEATYGHNTYSGTVIGNSVTETVEELV